jgi:hypothetical protein
MRGLALTLAFGALLALAPGASARPHKRCAIPGGAPIASNREAVVLHRNVTYSELEDGVEIWGCLRSRRRPVLVASASRDQYSSSGIDAVVLRGRFVAYTRSGGVIDGTCQAGLAVFSLARRRVKWSWSGQGLTPQCPSVGALLLTSRGRAGFTEALSSGPVRVHKLDVGGDTTLDEGQGIAPDSLSLAVDPDGATLSWSNAGQPRSARLY